MEFDQFKRELEEFEEQDDYMTPKSKSYNVNGTGVTEEDLKQVIEKDAYGEERSEDVNVYVTATGAAKVFGRDTEHGRNGKRPESFREAEKVLQQNAHGEEVRDVKVEQDENFGVVLKGEDTGENPYAEKLRKLGVDTEEEDYTSNINLDDIDLESETYDVPIDEERREKKTPEEILGMDEDVNQI